MSTDLLVEDTGAGTVVRTGQKTRLFHVYARSGRAKAWLRLYVDPEDAPAEDNYGRKFIVLMREDLGDALEKARLAGLTMEFIHEDPDDNSPIPA